MRDYTAIEVMRHEIVHGRAHYTYRWVGPVDGVVRVSDDEMLPALLRDAPWPLEVVDVDPWLGVTSVMRRDTRGGLHIIWYRLCHWLNPAYAWLRTRIVLTLMVWGLAYVSEAEIASWDCIGRRRPDWQRPSGQVDTVRDVREYQPGGGLVRLRNAWHRFWWRLGIR